MVRDKFLEEVMSSGEGLEVIGQLHGEEEKRGRRGPQACAGQALRLLTGWKGRWPPRREAGPDHKGPGKLYCGTSISLLLKEKRKPEQVEGCRMPVLGHSDAPLTRVGRGLYRTLLWTESPSINHIKEWE